MKTVYRIYPAIGIARIGNSESEYFFGPESPGIVPPGPYRDNSGKIKPQAVRFRIYKFIRDDFGKETIDSEIVANEKTRIRWNVHLVNSKAAEGNFPPGGPGGSPRNPGYDRAGLIVEAGLQSISGKSRPNLPLSGKIEFRKDGNVEGSA